MDRRTFCKQTALVAAVSPVLPWEQAAAVPQPLHPRQLEFEHKAAPLELVRNENPCGLSPLAAQALATVPDLYHRYVMQDQYLWELRQALAQQAGVSPAGTKLAAGSSTILFQAIQRLANRHLILSDPDFYRISVYTETLQTATIKVPVLAEQLTPDLDRLARCACSHPRGLLYLSNPHLPYGGYHSPATIAAFLEKIPASTTVLLDEAYIHYAGDALAKMTAAPLTRKFRNLIVTRTFSKIYGMAALRLGALFHHPESNGFWFQEDERTIAAPVAAAGIAALGDTAHVERSLALVHDSRRWLFEFARQNGFRAVGGHGNFVTFLFDESTHILRAKLAHAGYAVAQGLDDHYLRITLAGQESLTSFGEALKIATR